MSLKLDLWRLIMDKVKIKDVCDILNGFAFKSDNYVDKGIRIIRIANVQKGYIEDSTPAFYPLNSTGLDKYMLDKGDLLISLTGNVGRVAILQEEMLPAALNQRVACLRIKSDKISKGYLFHILNSDFFERKCIQSAKGVAQKNMSTEWLKNYKIPLYSTEQQSEIVSVLDTLQSIICNRKYELQMLDNLIKARFVEMFGDPIENPKNWEITTVGDIVTEVRYGTSKPAVDGGQYPYLRMNNLTADGHLDLRDLKYIDISDEEIEKCVVRTGDVLFNRTNSIDLVGKTAVFDLSEEMVIAGYIIRVRLKENMLPEVFSEYMNLKALKDILRSMAKGAVNQANINAQELQSIRIYLPDIELQKQFVTIKTQIDKSKATVQKALDETQLLFDSLMQQYFG